MQKFELPSNIKQIGSIDDGLRIYVEDYVCTYLKQYAESGGHCEKIALLVGKYLIIDSQPVVFINGAIQGKYCENDDGVESFTEKSLLYAEEQINQYFKGLEIIGWMQSQPGYSIFLNPAYALYHMTHFKKPYQMLFVVDPVEKMNVFYVWNDAMDGLLESKGYFVYYDKNPGMQEYMLDNKLISLNLREKAANTDKIKTAVNKGEREPVTVKENPPQRFDRNKRESLPRNRVSPDIYDNKRLVNMLVSLSAVLFVISFIMGAGLVQNDGRINELEGNLQTLNNAYTYLVAQIKQGTVQSVFASQDQIDQDVTEQGATDKLASGKNITDGIITSIDDLPVADIGQDGLPDEAIPADIQPQSEQPQSEQSQPEQPTPQAIETPEPAPVQQTALPPQDAAEVINIEPKESIKEQTTYVVQQGDNLNYISIKFFGTAKRAKDIMEANNITDPDKIYFGKILIIPN